MSVIVDRSPFRGGPLVYVELGASSVARPRPTHQPGHARVTMRKCPDPLFLWSMIPPRPLSCLPNNHSLIHSLSHHFTSPNLKQQKFENLKVGDWVKIDLGVHIDGFMAVAAHTVIVGYKPRTAEEGGPITDDTADVFAAAWTAAEVAARMIKAGNTNAQVTAKVKEVADAYGVRGIIGTLMHQMKRYVIDGSKMILLREEPDQAKVDPCTFETYEVYAIDVAMTTGEGKPRDLGQNRTTIYKRVVDQKYSLKVKASRMLFNDILKKHPALPFTLRGFQDEKAVKLGIRECENHNLLQPYQVLHQYPGDKIAHVKFTVLLTKDQTVKVTGLAPPEGMLSSKTVSAELQELLKISVEKKKKDRSKK